MQEAAQKADKEHKLRRFGYVVTSKVAGDHATDDEEEQEEIDEMTTNITSKDRNSCKTL